MGAAGGTKALPGSNGKSRSSQEGEYDAPPRPNEGQTAPERSSPGLLRVLGSLLQRHWSKAWGENHPVWYWQNFVEESVLWDHAWEPITTCLLAAVVALVLIGAPLPG